LAEAYSYYTKGLEQLQAALLIEDKITRNQSLCNCQAMFVKSHSVYDNAYFDQQINLPAHLRRLECSWAISSSMAEVYCLQLEYRAGLHSYQELQRRICRDVETLKTKLNAQNHQFVGADLQWLFENDMKIIAAKIQALDSYQKQRVFPSLSLQPPLMLDEAGLKTLSVGGVKGYIDCLLSKSNNYFIVMGLKDKEIYWLLLIWVSFMSIIIELSGNKGFAELTHYFYWTKIYYRTTLMLKRNNKPRGPLYYSCN
jgi:hypothetical protein